MSDHPRVSVIIPFYNCLYVDQAIESALQQQYPNFEVIVVNDGATRYRKKIAPYLKQIRYVTKENGGTASALNAGIRHASGHYFAWLSADDRFKPDKLAKQMAFMQEQGAYASFSGYELIDQNGQVIGRQVEAGIPRKLDIYANMMNGCIINGCTVMLRMDVFREVGLFDERLRYANDYDMWLRVLSRYDFFYLNDALVQYRIHEQMGSRRFADDIARETEQIRHIHRPLLQQRMETELRSSPGTAE